MYENIVVPIDLSERPRPAILAALELRGKSSARITLLHVIETLRDVEFEELEEFYTALRRRAEARLEEGRGELGSELEVQVVYGSRAAEVLRFAEQHGADLLVLASHAVDRERPAAGLGTISHQLALLARCAVLLVR